MNLQFNWAAKIGIIGKYTAFDLQKVLKMRFLRPLVF
jgi:hypothetical protein